MFTIFFLLILSPSEVKEIDLALWRSAEAIANDTREFMNDGEWELLSIPSHYWQMRQDDTDYAHIQFNVSSSPLKDIHDCCGAGDGLNNKRLCLHLHNKTSDFLSMVSFKLWPTTTSCCWS